MERKIHWHLMNWQEIRDAQERNPVVLVPAGTLETQGPYTYVGLECVMPVRLGEEVARRTGSLLLPVMPFGYSALFQDFPGTITLRPEILEGVYEDVIRSLFRHGFDHILFLAMHIPNQPMMEHVANRVRDELGLLVGWINPASLQSDILKEVSPNFAAARGHGADSGLSMALYLEPEAIDVSNRQNNEFAKEFRGWKVEGMTPNLNGIPLNMATRMQDFSPKSGGMGDPRYGTREQGEIMFTRIAGHVTALVEKFATMDTRIPAQK